MYHVPVWLRCFSNCWLCARTYKDCKFGFLQPFGSPRHKLCWFSKPDIMDPSVQVPQAGAHTTFSLGGTSAIVISLLLLGHHMGSEGRVVLNWLILCFSYPSQCGFLFISVVVENLFCSSSGVFRDSHSICTCSFGVNEGRLAQVLHSAILNLKLGALLLNASLACLWNVFPCGSCTVPTTNMSPDHHGILNHF